MESAQDSEKVLVILMAHGSRHLEGARQAEVLMESIIEKCPFPTEKAYLELREPDLETCIKRHISKRTNFFILPLLIFRGGHALRDIPEIMLKCKETYPQSHFQQGPVLEPIGDMLNFWIEYGKSWLEEHDEGQVMLLGRGAKDSEACEAFERMAQQLEGEFELSVIRAFTGLQEPNLSTAMEGVEKGRALLIFPCLLFDGILLENSREKVKGWKVTWAPTLSHSPKLLGRTLDLINEGLGEV
jgi:sirohydrochlorin ferrochelatase